MMSNIKIMTLARKALKGFWLKSIGMTILGGFLSGAIIFAVSLTSILFLETGTDAPQNYLVSFVFEMAETILVEILFIGFYAYIYDIYKYRKSIICRFQEFLPKRSHLGYSRPGEGLLLDYCRKNLRPFG